MHIFHIKRITAVFAAVFCILALAGCSNVQALAMPTPDPSAVLQPVTGICTISKNGDVFTVSGKTDVMNGTLVDVSVVAQNGMVIDHQTITKTQDDISVDFTITADKLEDIVDLKGYLTIAPSFYGNQSSDVYTAYGKKFQNMTAEAENLEWTNEGVIVLFASDWLYGLIPSPTAGPTPSPSASDATSASAETSVSAETSPSA